MSGTLAGVRRFSNQLPEVSADSDLRLLSGNPLGWPEMVQRLVGRQWCRDYFMTARLTLPGENNFPQPLSKEPPEKTNTWSFSVQPKRANSCDMMRLAFC